MRDAYHARAPKSKAPIHVLCRFCRTRCLAHPTKGGVERQFSRSGRAVTPLRHCLQPDSVHEIMMYKNHLSRKYQKELVLFEDAGAMVVEEGKLETEVEPPHLREWKDQWWKERKRRNRL